MSSRAIRGTEALEIAGDRLKSWKQIADHFGTSVSTVQRWAARRGLPVTRPPGGAPASVFADVAELESWFRGQPRVSATDVDLAGPPARSRIQFPASGGRWMVLGALGLLLIGGGLLATTQALTWSSTVPARHQPTRRALDLYLAGRYEWERRTPESLRRAVRSFQDAIALDPAYADAYVGLADCFLLLREFAGMPDRQAYALARRASERALAFDDRNAEAHAAHAFVTFFGAFQFDSGLAEFRQALALDPNSARARHWYATALFHAGQPQEALQQIGEAQQRDPQSRSILSDRGLILFFAGRADEAIGLLRDIERDDPNFLSPHSYLAMIYRAQGNDAEFIREGSSAARLLRDANQVAVLQAGSEGFAAGGHQQMLRAILEHQRPLYALGRLSAYKLAETLAQAGQADGALRYLEASARAGEPDLVLMRVDPLFGTLRADARFVGLASQTGA